MIGWYVHDHGSGHRRRLEAVAAHLDEPVTGMGSGTPAAGVEWLALPPDAGAVDRPHDPTAGGGLHWAPLGEPGMLGRADLVSSWVRESGCRLLVVDVSVEMLLLGRLLGLPTVAVLQPGRRDDRAHALGYDSASALLAPWPEAASGRSRTRWSARTGFTGGFSRFDGRARERADVGCGPGRCVALVLGRGGHDVTAPDVRGAAAATAAAAARSTGTPDPDRVWHWHVAGTLVGGRAVDRADVVEHGRLDDVWPLLCRADVVVGPSGGGLVADVAAAGTPFLALPQERPFDEQVELSRLLRRVDVAEVARRWPSVRSWPRLLDRVAARAPGSGERWRAWSDGHGAARAAELVQRAASAATSRAAAGTEGSVA